ncbi:Zinc carboxypeptidase [Owenweeksia hongkongensis DSM 17368]|uniref:Zinc carboxypeptidase n=1 Tax=Owenweeksia hongkongensis (strain DSM 17368 / CIP 108786 / JCM 12287 / NRRL B-23963 / UST20020801) TaxID=926562 RepID=G8R6V2_OWEHD|nr:M14 family zinc carboxypeptidase [Owenweeksia hongkongensis]AEV32287.1 Zinc carboxypeptidase [Owenweeksia hongkongensis DSM 17368]
MRFFLIWIISGLTSTTCLAQLSELYLDGISLTYDQVISSYQELALENENASLVEIGPTDSGRKLHLFLIGSNPMKDDATLQDIANDKAVVLINNGIHPGESCGIDASIIFAREILQKKILDDVLIAIVPVYNIGGALNRGSFSRANQDGPEEHGFRGNSRNLDLNRDFVKADALNTISFYTIFQALQPHIFVDTHTSNGADYQYTMTLISTQKDKLNPVLAETLTKDLEPFLYKQMNKKGWPMTPYVNVFGNTPDKGFAAFLETPRYASGYTTLFNTIGFITETHMLKPYKDRVASTLAFLHVMNKYVADNSSDLKEAKKKAFEFDQQQNQFAINWTLDSSKYELRKFKGYEYSYPESMISGSKRLKYDGSKPKTFDIKYYNTWKTADSAMLPAYYVVPRAWREVAYRLQLNGVIMEPLKSDTIINVNSYYIQNPKFSNYPYEGHFPLRDMEVEIKYQQRAFLAGDYLVPTKQKNIRFIVSMLEPKAVDSYLRWNFYDEIFQQKEHFSPYVFEETAEQLLKDNEDLKTAFEEWKEKNPELLSNSYPALKFIYENSVYYEKEHLRYPVARIE